MISIRKHTTVSTFYFTYTTMLQFLYIYIMHLGESPKVWEDISTEQHEIMVEVYCNVEGELKVVEREKFLVDTL